MTCIVLSLIASAAEVAVAISLVPLLALLGVASGDGSSGLAADVSPAFWLGLFAVLAVVRSAANWLSSIQTERGTQELVVALQDRLYRALSTAHWDTVRRLSPPTITSALQTQSYDAAWGFTSLIQVIASGVLVLGYVLSAVVVFPTLLVVVLPLLAAMWWLNTRRSQQVGVISEHYVDAQTELHGRYEDWVAISRIASLGVDAQALADRFEAGARSAAAHSIEFRKSSANTRLSYEVAVLAAVLIGVPFAWWQETPPALLAYGLLLLVRVLPRLGSIQTGYQSIINAVAPLKAIDQLATQLERSPAFHGNRSQELAWTRFELGNVAIEDTVREGGRRWILRTVDLSLNHGEWLALTGETGAGKTTLAEVMLMLVRPDEGQLSLDGNIVDDMLAGAWRNQAAYVPQDVVLFDASIRDNLRLYAPDASDNELEAALRQSAAEFVMERLPEGLDTRAGPGGRWLSGGERQRIGIARALLSKPGFLVLDEPTAALDTDTQAKLMDALGNLDHTMSVVLITHRPELLKLADRVVELEDGRVRR
jgi:ATP-binding cassette subfamily C protein